MLFSEPKIPQSAFRVGDRGDGAGFSALQRAENSSILPAPARRIAVSSFSALQRAENSSILLYRGCLTETDSFSALQRAENSSMHLRFHFQQNTNYVSVLFSEPKIPQRNKPLRCNA